MAAVTYTVSVWRESTGDWSATADTVEGANTWGASLSEVDRKIREAIAVVLDLPRGAEERMQVVLRARVGDDVDPVVDEARAAREAAARASHLTALAVLRLRSRGVSIRDTARILDITSGRVSQIEKEHAAA
jgi:predicted RNase H-like HicB family nuclease